MKRKFIRCMMGICVIGMMSAGVYGCGAEGGSEEPVQAEAEAPEEGKEEDVESPEDEEGEDEKSPEAGPEKDVHEAELMGDIKEIGDGQFRIAEATTGETEDGEETLVVTAAGAEDVNLKTVVYDEDTVFTFQTIRDGGASHEEREGSAEDLAKELMADMKGYYEEDVFHATEIQVIKVIL